MSPLLQQGIEHQYAYQERFLSAELENVARHTVPRRLRYGDGEGSSGQGTIKELAAVLNKSLKIRRAACR